MRRMAFLMFALTMIVSANGCVLSRTNCCTSSSSSCGSSGGCGSNGGCAGGRFGGWFGGGHGFGVCDCEEDDYCTSRTPWVRHSHSGASVLPQGEPIPAPAKELPKKKL